MTDILENIISYKKGNRDDILYVLEKIDPLLKKYAFKLDYEDAYFDLQLFVNPKLLGGFSLTVEGKQFDASFSKQITKLKKEFNKNIYERIF